MNELTLSEFAEKVPSIAADTSLLQAASSFISPVDNLADPRARPAFEAIATAFCNGAPLFLPLPRDSEGDMPFLYGLWANERTVQKRENLELEDQGFVDIGHQVADAFSVYVEGDPYSVADWLAFQFTDGISHQYETRAVFDPIERSAPLAARLIDDKRLPKFEIAIHNRLHEGKLRQPDVFDRLISRPPIPSFLYLCVSYALSVCLRGWSYATNLGQLENPPVYRHFWLRSPALRANVGRKVKRRIDEEKPAWFPWGPILSAAIVAEDKGWSENRVQDVMRGLREKAPLLRSHAFPGPPKNQSKAIDDDEAFILGLLLDVGAAPRYADTTRAEKLGLWLRTIVDGASPFMKIPAEIVTSTMQNRWLRHREAKLRIHLKRDRFGDVFDDPKIRRSITQFENTIRKMASE